MRGLGWGKKHATVDYVFLYPRAWLVRYHLTVTDEMTNRGYKPAEIWHDPCYRGKRAVADEHVNTVAAQDYPEHDQEYLIECLENLREKGHDLQVVVGLDEE